MRIICHNNVIETHRRQALLRHVDNEDADEANAVAVAASVARKCNTECLIGYDTAGHAHVVLNMSVVETCVVKHKHMK